MIRAYRRVVAAGLGVVVGLALVPVVTEPAAARSGTRKVRLTADQAAFLSTVAGAARTSQRRYGVPASVVIAQAVLETGWGTSELARTAHNYFGMTCGPVGGGPVATGCREGSDRVCGSAGCAPTTVQFRVYRTVADSFVDHGRLLSGNSRYRKAFKARANADRFTRRMAAAGYATDPGYAGRLIKIMAKYKLYRYNKR